MRGNGIVIKGRLTGPRNVELDEPVSAVTPEVEVIVRPLAPAPADQSVVDFLRRLPPGQRTRQEIDRELRQERDAWEKSA